jgi:hypothetical protein
LGINKASPPSPQSAPRTSPRWPCANTRALAPSSFLHTLPFRGCTSATSATTLPRRYLPGNLSATQVLQTAAKCYISCCKCYNRPLRPLPFHSELSNMKFEIVRPAPLHQPGLTWIRLDSPRSQIIRRQTWIIVSLVNPPHPRLFQYAPLPFEIRIRHSNFQGSSFEVCKMSKNHRQRVGQTARPPVCSLSRFLTFAPSSDGHRPFLLLLSMPANLAQNPFVCPSRFASFASSARKWKSRKIPQKPPITAKNTRNPFPLRFGD